MGSLPFDFAAQCRAAGLTVIEIDGAKTRGRPGSFAPVGSNNHHTGASAKGWTKAKELAYAKWMFLTGRSDLPAPLVQIALGRSGIVYIGAYGRANHAGKAKAAGSVSAGDGNTLYVGIEWMLSGTEAIPPAQMQAGITLNAVITEKATKTSVQTIVCHYNTSLTGKWDIGDPNGVPFKNVKVLDIPKFRSAVQARREDLYQTKKPGKAPSGKPSVIMPVGHLSGQASDTPAQWRHDLGVALHRNNWVLTGTEVGEAINWAEVKAAAKAKGAYRGYIVRRHRSNWIGVRRDIVKRGTLKTKSVVIAKAAQVSGPGHDTVYLLVTFEHVDPRVGTISYIAAHGPTNGRPDAKDPARRINLQWTRKLGRAVAAEAAVAGSGKALCFYGGDQNIVDQSNDTFFGGPLLSCWDELQKWPKTHPGAGNIDVIASYNGDKRVSCVSARRFTDKQLFLHTDHYFVEAKYRIELI